MYAVIRAGGKQYRVAPGDVIHVEKQAAADGQIEFELLAIGSDGKVGRPEGEARVTGQVMGEGRGKKILVFHYKKKKQYKKLAGHRQPFTAVRITEITANGQTENAPALPEQQGKSGRPKATEGGAAPEEAVAPKRKTAGKKSASGPAKGAGSKTTRSAGTSKSTKGGAPPTPGK
jgi:large subunit ribosomal protein L21